MFGFSLTEILLILAVALVVLGPEKIPDVARMLGEGIREVRKASNMMRDALMIDDPGPSRPKPKPRTAQTIEEEDQEWMPDPTPQRDIRLSRCSPRLASDEVVELELSERKNVEKMREVYLHIPYIETI